MIRLLIAIPFLFLTGCFTQFVHELAFPEGYDYDFVKDFKGIGKNESAFNLCFQSTRGDLIQLNVTGGQRITSGLSFSEMEASGEGKIWHTESITGCTDVMQRGQDEDAKLLFLSGQSVSIGSNARAVMSVGDRRAALVELGSNSRVRIKWSDGVTQVFRRATPAELHYQYQPVTENAYVIDEDQQGTFAKNASIKDVGGAVGIYYKKNDQELGLKLFPAAQASTAPIQLIYVPYLNRFPSEPRYYLIPLYPLAIILDAVTGVAQIVGWIREGTRDGSCLR